MPPFFLPSAVVPPRRLTAALSKRRARGRGFENRGGVFRLSRRGGELVLFFAFVFFSIDESKMHAHRAGGHFSFSLSLLVRV